MLDMASIVPEVAHEVSPVVDGIVDWSDNDWNVSLPHEMALSLAGMRFDDVVVAS
jgi:hypothetical protein